MTQSLVKVTSEKWLYCHLSVSEEDPLETPGAGQRVRHTSVLPREARQLGGGRLADTITSTLPVIASISRPQQ